MTALKRSDWRRWRPTPDELLLVDAAISPGTTAAAAWKSWRAMNAPDRAEEGHARLFAQIWKNVPEQGMDGADARVLKAVLLPLATRHRLAREAFIQATKALVATDMPVIVLKGSVLATLYYPAPWCRPMNDVDLCVREADLPRAATALKSAGWEPEQPGHLRCLDLHHAATFRRAGHAPIDLHWRLMSTCLYPGADHEAWRRAVRISDTTPPALLRLAPEDEFLLCCQHGARPNPTRPIRWLVDGAHILRHSPSSFDADRLFREAGRRRLIRPLADTVIPLARQFGVKEAGPLADRAEAMSAGWIERAADRLETAAVGRYAWEWHRVARYLRLSAGAGRIPTPWGCIHALARESRGGNVGGYLRGALLDRLRR